MSVGGGDAGSLRGGGALPSLDVAGSFLPGVPAGGSDGPWEVAPMARGRRSLLFFYNNLEPLEHSVPDHAGPAGRHIAVGPVGPFRTLSSPDCHPAGPAGPAGPYVAGGPVVTDVLFQVLEPLEHSVLDPADLAGQHAAVGPVGPFRMLSSSDCHPAGPAGPYVAGGPVGPDDLFEVLEPLEHSVLDHADPAGQHAVIQDELEPLEHSVLDTVLDGRPMEGAPVLEPIEHSVWEKPLDGGPVKGAPVRELIEHSVLEKPLDDEPMRGDFWFGTARAIGSVDGYEWCTYGGGASSGTDRAFGSGKAPGRWTYGGDINGYGTARAFGSGDDLGRWTFRENVGLGTVDAFGSKCYPGRSTHGGDTKSGTVRAFGSGDGPGQWTYGGDVTFGTVGPFGSECSPGRSTYGGDPR